MDLNKMCYFLEVARLGSYSKAANKLNISQSQLSRILITLETEIGSKLIDRSNKHIKLTESGKYLYEKGNYILNVSKDVEKKCKDLNSGINGIITIGKDSHLLGTTITKTLKSFNEKHKDVSYKFIDLSSADIIANIKNGILDFGIVKGPFNSSELGVLELPKANYILIGKEQDILTLENFTLDKLSSLKLILTSNTKEVLSKHISNLNENILCECSDESAVISLVEEGLAFGITHKDYFSTFNTTTLSSINLQIIDETKTSLIYLKENYKKNTIQNFLKELEEHLPLKMRGKIFF